MKSSVAQDLRTWSWTLWSWTFVSAVLLCGPTARAADNGIVLGASALEASSDYDIQSSLDVREGRGFKLIGGIRPLDRLGIEANYVDLGTARADLSPALCPAVIGFPCPGSASLELDTTAVSVSAIGYFTIPFVDLYGRIGMARWESDFTAAGFEDTEQGTDPTFGAGAQVRVGSFALRLEYERFKLADDSADAVSLGFTYTFL